MCLAHIKPRRKNGDEIFTGAVKVGVEDAMDGSVDRILFLPRARNAYVLRSYVLSHIFLWKIFLI